MEQVECNPRWSRANISSWLQYLYFARVSWITSLFLPLLILLDLSRVSADVTRAIFTLDSWEQTYYATFFIIATNMAVLLTVRNTVRNGLARFKSQPPWALYRWMTDATPKRMWAVLAVVQSLSVGELGYLLHIGSYEKEETHPLAMLSGLLASLVFWYLISLFYYWTYRPVAPLTGFAASVPEPAALIFPHSRKLFGDINETEPPPRLMEWIDAGTKWFLTHISQQGFAESVDGPIWELHFLSTLSLLGIFLIYLFLYPLTSPVLRSNGASYGETGFCLLVLAVFLRAVAHTGDRTVIPGERSRWGQPVKWLFIALAIGFSAAFIVALRFDQNTGEPRLAFAFPTLASLLVIVGFLLWFLGGAAFFLDRYRLPVVTTLLAVIFVPKLIDPVLGEWFMHRNWPVLAEIFDADHYFSVHRLYGPLNPERDIPGTDEAVSNRVRDIDEPYIIVTASGGGIQAAEWTAQVLAGLEKSFAEDDRLKSRPVPYTFHDHLLLASSVSGGSLGLMSYLLEYSAYDEDKKDEPPAPIFPAGTDSLFNRITLPAQCSSLEAVGWGLSYHDLYRLVVPIRFPTSLDDDYSPDRSWALAAAFNRNLHDKHCGTDRGQTKPHPQFSDLPAIRDGEGFTLLAGARLLSDGSMPAFTFNTTAAETGSRFLLSNYRVPSKDKDSGLSTCGSEFTPAESFLQVYAAKQDDCAGTDQPNAYADLPLATAARLSATFPLVSSGTRIPPAYSRHGFHFLDGGYFDNDGTASVIEFLKSVYDRDSTVMPHDILLIEIRDDDGTAVDSDIDDIRGQNAKKPDGAQFAPPWTPVTQLSGVFDGLWNAGHVSIARRNRRELCIFETASVASSLNIHHVVFTIPNGSDDLSPLSWNLTTGQIANITLRGKSTTDQRQEAATWVANHLPGGSEFGSREMPCQVHSQDSTQSR